MLPLPRHAVSSHPSRGRGCQETYQIKRKYVAACERPSKLWCPLPMSKTEGILQSQDLKTGKGHKLKTPRYVVTQWGLPPPPPIAATKADFNAKPLVGWHQHAGLGESIPQGMAGEKACRILQNVPDIAMYIQSLVHPEFRSKGEPSCNLRDVT